MHRVGFRLPLAALPAALSGVVLLAACGSDAIDTPVASSSRAAQVITPSGAATAPPSATCTPAPVAAGQDSFADSVALTTTADGLQYGDITVGTGAVPQKGQNLTVQYTGWLTNGCVFDTSRQAGRTPFSFVIGATPPGVIAGWDEGLLTMHVGGKRRLVIPAALAYGSQGQGSIPANATLVFEVELLSIGAASPTP
jgi:peptidylprolyl isomerase